MKLIIDTNIFFSGLIKDSITRKILLNPKFEFYVPEYFLSELNKYIPEIMKKAKLKNEELEKLINFFLEKIHLVPINEYKENLEKATEIFGIIDKKDIAFIALALSIKNDGIWSNDKDFDQQTEIKVFTTNEIMTLL